MTDTDLFARIKSELFTAVIGDALDVMGYRHQFLPPGLGPVQPGTRIVGRAMPVLEAAYPEGTGQGPLADQPFGVMFQALDDLKPGEIYITSGASLDFALWGGLMSTRAQHLGAAGAILDGYVRDTDEIRALGFPVFARGAYAQDQGVRGKVVDFRTPITIGAVQINTGDLIVADNEGVLIIPRSAEDAAIAAAFEKVATENKVATAIRNGMSSQEAFATFGVM
ncbi:RraA family protein [Marinovum sp. 2_MG-2023]|uniref:RraA family protein n=1 Tax=unclassified Marinovum TaxID=2647166 RepID=UPI0026E1C6E6|nr:MULTISPECIES: RraA family protein [unclassified Marinovum]MDO6732550.1 RraA family protein [Marinovum sp. 2_MG-2023]MDO6781818.1 RraA family protein [Marinovum sp. 1_MG-2023]